MKEFKVSSVLIAVDYDPSAEMITETGYSIAKSSGAKVTLLHVIANTKYYSSLAYSPITGFLGSTSADFQDLVDTNGLIAATKDYLERTRKYLGDDTIEIIVKEGDTADIILKTAKQVYADLIVVGSHSRGRIEKALVGSVTEEILNKSTVPLFIVPIKSNK